MFTGIVGCVGEVVGVREREGGREIRIRSDRGFLEDVPKGASISVDGACLTPVRLFQAEFVVEAIGTTLARTVAGGYHEGSRVNLEKALAMGGRLDGHLVQGHVDGVGHLISSRKEGGHHLLEVSVPEEVERFTLLHGSIALNGVSLTVNRLPSPGRVEVAIIPHTWEQTNLRYLETGDPVNVEGDLIGKYVGKLLSGVPGVPKGIGGSETPSAGEVAP
jgi:riboflavin synthase